MLAFLVDQPEDDVSSATPIHNNINVSSASFSGTKNDDCLICKNDQSLYIKAIEKKKYIQCSVCQKNQHPICYNIAQVNDHITNNFACIQCRILQNQPELIKFDQVVGPMRVLAQDHTNKIDFKLSEAHTLNLYRNQYNELCVYCMKLDMFDSSGRYQYYNWPSDNIVININNSIQSYNLDTLCIIDKNDYNLNESNTFTFNIGNIQAMEQKHIIIGIGLVQVGNMCQVIEKIVLNQTQSEQEIVNQYKEWAKDLEISIPLKDQITQTLIKWPARGKACKHFTCIDMYTFLEFNLTNTNLEKSRWACPTCQNKMYSKDIIFDKHLHKFITNQIIGKISPEYISLIEDVVCDQNSNLKIGDESMEKIKRIELKKILSKENLRIEQQMQQSKIQFQTTIKNNLLEQLHLPLIIPPLQSDKFSQLQLFKQTYPIIDQSNVEQIFHTERDFILSFNSYEFIYFLMEEYTNLKDLQLITHAELMYLQSIEDIVKIFIANTKINQIQFTFIHLYAQMLCEDEESKYSSYICQCLSYYLTKKYNKHNFQIDTITPSFILLAMSYSIYENQISNAPPGMLIGALFYFFQCIMNIPYLSMIQLFVSFINLTGHESFYLSQIPQSIDLLADALHSYLILSQSTNEKLNKVDFFQRIFIKQIRGLFSDQSNTSVTKQICLFKTINQTLYRQYPQFNQKPYKQAKEFISQLVDKDKAIISHLKSIANSIF